VARISIHLLSALPNITDAVTIDGTSEPGYNGKAGGGSRRSALTTSTVNGLFFTVGNSTVKGLAIDRFSGSGIFLSGGGNDVIQGNYLGTNPGLTAGYGNKANGIFVVNVGGTPSVEPQSAPAT